MRNPSKRATYTRRVQPRLFLLILIGLPILLINLSDRSTYINPLSVRTGWPERRSGIPAANYAASISEFNEPDSETKAEILKLYERLPLAFEANHGQIDPQVRFISRGGGYNIFLTSSGVVFAPDLGIGKRLSYGLLAYRSARSASSCHDLLHMKLLGPNQEPEIVGLEELSGKVNYFKGSDPKKWRTDISTYSRVMYRNVYPGIDMIYRGNRRHLEYDFVIAPGADPKVVKLDFSGARRVKVDTNGDLLLTTNCGEVRYSKPYIYQDVGVRQDVAGSYVIDENHQVSFTVGIYDSSRPLVIDPVLTYSTYLGTSGQDFGNDIIVDSSGNAYIGGMTNSPEFPVQNAVQPSKAGGFDGNLEGFVTKLNFAGSAFVYSTFLGGSNSDRVNGIRVDSAGNTYLAGQTDSQDFPTANPLQPSLGGQSDAFLAKLNPTGSALIYSTFLGGNDVDLSSSIALDTSGNELVSEGVEI